jgi:hypothetical protein
LLPFFPSTAPECVDPRVRHPDVEKTAP